MDLYYKILGLKTDASLEDIENKYDELLNQFDPSKQSDKNLNDLFISEQVKIKDAYKNILLNFNKTNNAKSGLEIDKRTVIDNFDDLDNSYSVLQLPKDSTLEKIKEKYNLLLDEFDPDHQSLELKDFFQTEHEKVKTAYNIIIDNLASKKSIDYQIDSIEKWVCLVCKEQNEPNFDVCWNCVTYKYESESQYLGEYENSIETKFCRFCGKKQYKTNSECIACKKSLISFVGRVLTRSDKKRMFSSSFSFVGRIRRSEYFASLLIAFLSYYLVFFILFQVICLSFNAYIYHLFNLPVYWFLLAQSAKRCHDRGSSGWMQLVPLYSLFMLFGDGNIGDNEYGANPKGFNYI